MKPLFAELIEAIQNILAKLEQAEQFKSEATDDLYGLLDSLKGMAKYEKNNNNEL